MFTIYQLGASDFAGPSTVFLYFLYVCISVWKIGHHWHRVFCLHHVCKGLYYKQVFLLRFTLILGDFGNFTIYRCFTKCVRNMYVLHWGLYIYIYICASLCITLSKWFKLFTIPYKSGGITYIYKWWFCSSQTVSLPKGNWLYCFFITISHDYPSIIRVLSLSWKQLIP